MNKAAKTVGFMFIMILFSKVLGQVREMIIASSYGASFGADAFYAASTLPLNLFDIVFASAISSAFIPVYNTYMQKCSKAEGDKFASSFINAVFLCSFVVSILLMIFSSPLIGLLAPGLEGEARQLAVSLSIIMMPVITVASLTFSFVGILQSHGEFNIPAVMSLISNGVVIIYLLFFNAKFGIYGLSVSLLVGWILQFLIQIPVSKKIGFHYSFTFYHKGLIDVVKLSLPVLVGTWIQPISNIINTAFASSVDSGISSLNYASKLYMIVSTVFTVSVTNYAFPLLSKQAASNDDKEFNKTLSTCFKTILLILIPISVLMMTLHTPIIEIVYKRGEFTDKAAYLTSGAFMYYSIGIVFYGLLDLFNKAFYAKKCTLVPAITAVSAIGINIIASYFLKKTMGVFGLALATSIISAFMAITLFIILNKKVSFFTKKEIIYVVKLLIFGAISFICVKICNSFMIFDKSVIMKIASVLISSVVGVGVYVGLVFVWERDIIKQLK